MAVMARGSRKGSDGVLQQSMGLKRIRKTKFNRKGVWDMRRFLTGLWYDESGISSVEYALLLAFIAAGIIVGAEALSEAVRDEMCDAATIISGDTAAGDCPT